MAQRLGFEWRCAGQQLVHQHAQRVDIAPAIELQPAHLSLFRAHVFDRPDYEACCGERCAARRLFSRNSAQLRQAKVEELDSAPVRDHDVSWFEVAVDDALLMCGIQCVRYFRRDLNNACRSHLLPRKYRTQSVSFH